MKLLFLQTLLFFLLKNRVVADNKFPIVLVHGVAGWGRNELFGFKYFGGFHGDIESELKSKGYTVYTAAVGPVSSNWDRACELYAQIKGGVVDYGENHSKKHSHERYGDEHIGFYPEWGTKDQDGFVRKLHFIGHSMGGQTIRLLSQLLANGTKGAPSIEDPQSHPLFEGGRGSWVHSITTISTPHHGTVLADWVASKGSPFKNIILKAITYIGLIIGSENIYNFKLGHWGIDGRKYSESISDYFNRVFESSIFDSSFQDTALHDLTMKGAKELNSWVTNHPYIHYFSYSTADTVKIINPLNWQTDSSVHIGNSLTMVLPLHVSAAIIGGTYTTVDKKLNRRWQENDGCVPLVSQLGVSNGQNRTVKFELGRESRAGRWQHMPHLSNTDHLSICGMAVFNNPFSIYETHASFLHTLPKLRRRRIQKPRSLRETSSTSIVGLRLRKAIDEFTNRNSQENIQKNSNHVCDAVSGIFNTILCKYLYL